jgi:hypothetical protein
MYCSKCGQEINGTPAFCPKCGSQIGNNAYQPEDEPNKGYAIIGFFLPIVGLILYLVYESKMPKKAKSAGKGALAGVITQVVLYILIAVVAPVILALFMFNNISTLNEDYSYSDSVIDSKTNSGGTTESKNTEPTTNQKIAVEKAKYYIETLKKSRQDVIDNLKDDKFTDSEINYVLNSYKVDWNEQAVRKAKYYIDTLKKSRQDVIDNLKDDKFTDSEINYALKKLNY